MSPFEATLNLRTIAHGVEELRFVAGLLERRQLFLAAGYAYDHAAHAAINKGVYKRAYECARSAWRCYQQALETQPLEPLRRVVALLLAGMLIRQEFLFGPGPKPEAQSNLALELAQTLATSFRRREDRSQCLVVGATIETDLLDRFEVKAANRETRWGCSLWTPSRLRLDVPSPFTLARYLGDYQLAHELIELCPDAFGTPALRGWRAAMLGHADPDSAAGHFFEAASAFEQDCAPLIEPGQPLGTWDSMNFWTWASYFRVRALVAQAVAEPHRVRELLEQAARYADTEAAGWAAPNVRCVALLVQALGLLLSKEVTVDVDRVRDEFLVAVRAPVEGDAVALRVLTLATGAFDSFRRSPEREIATGRLRDAIEALRRVPFIDSGIQLAPRQPVGAELARGGKPVSTWIHRTLRQIDSERQLQMVVLRLERAALALHAQLLYEAIEHGSFVILFERDGLRILRRYQVNVGDLGLPEWREKFPQLEEAPLCSSLARLVGVEHPAEREWVLICNGTVEATTGASIDRWIAEQQRAHGRHYQLMTLDDVVRWIFAERLVSELRVALRDLAIPLVEHSLEPEATALGHFSGTAEQRAPS